MNDVQCLIDRQLGFYNRFTYDNVLKRLVVREDECFYGYGLQSEGAEDPPIFACRFAEARGFEHILALANEDGRVAIQNISTNSLEGFQCHNNAVFDLAWMPGSMNFVTVSGDHTASLWDIAEGAPKRLLLFSSHTRSVKTAVFRPTEPTVFATGARDGHILIWDIRAGNQPAMAVLKPDNWLMNCHSCSTPKPPGSHGKRQRLDNHRAISITGLVFQDDRTLISCGECDGNIKVWDLRKNYSIYTREPLPKHSIPYCGSSTKNGYTNLIVDEARVRLYASCMDNVIYCFNIAAYCSRPDQRYVGHENGTFYIKTALSPDCKYLVSGSSDKSAYIWNVKCSQPVVRLSGHWAEVTCAAWARAPGPTIVTCSDDARHKVWRVGREEPEDTLRGRAELVPRLEPASLPHWGLQHTPASLKRRAAHTPGSSVGKRARLEGCSRTSKRSLAELLGATRDDDSPKRARLAPPDTPERPPPPASEACSPAKRARPDDWQYASPPGSSFLTPTKNYERKSCKILSPRSPRPLTADTCARSPIKVSPSKVRVITFSPPTRDLPDFVRTGEAPHLRLMSPVKKKPDAPDWLTQLRHARPAPAPPAAESPPAPARRASSDRAPKAKKTRTLLKYFSVSAKANAPVEE